MIIPDELKKLAKLFPTPLYVVGGAVRDALSGREVHDYDLTSSLVAEEVLSLLSGTEFKASPHSLKLGTLGIKVGSWVMEYTAFRRDSYAGSGSHAPEKVEFNCTQLDDALRRDFTVNAIYYDILKGEIVDPLGGVEDIKRGVLRTTRAPGEVMEEDALRILRLVRFACSFNYEIEESTYLEARARAHTLQEIAVERIREEFGKILVSDTVNGVKDAHIRGIKLMVELGLMEYVVPEILEGIGVKQNAKYHVHDVFNHTLEAVRVAPQHLRLVAFLHDVGKPRSIGPDGHMTGHAKVGAEMTRVIMTRLLYPHRDVEYAVRLIENHMFNVKCNLPADDVRVFALNNYDILLDLCDLKNADFYAHKMEMGESPAGRVLQNEYTGMLASGVAFSVKDLPVSGQDLIDEEVAPEKRATLLKALLTHGARLGRALTKEECLAFIRNR